MQTMLNKLSLLCWSRRHAATLPVAGLLAAASIGACAQDSTPQEGVARDITIAPRVTVSEVFTDNIRLVNTAKQSEIVTEFSPGIRVTRESGRLKGFLDYALTGSVYANASSPNRTQNQLNTFGSLEAIDNWAYVDFSGMVGQQSISAFGTQSSQDYAINANKTEVSNFQISPYLRGNIADLASYEARYSRAVVRDSAAVSGVATTDGIVNVSGSSAFKKLGWSVNASQQNIDYSVGRATEADLFNLGLSYAITPQFSVLASAGRERSNYTSLELQDYDTNSIGVNWTPSENTKLMASQGRRSFGETHDLNFEHRTALTVWKYVDSRTISSAPSQTGLLANSANPTAPVVSGFLSSAVSVQRRQDLSFTLLGIRDTVTLLATRSENRRLDTVSTAVDDLLASMVHQEGFSVNYIHRLTPVYVLAVLASQQRTLGVLSLPDANLYFLNIELNGKTGKNTSASLSLRRSVYTGGVSPYDETALSIQLIVQF